MGCHPKQSHKPQTTTCDRWQITNNPSLFSSLLSSLLSSPFHQRKQNKQPNIQEGQGKLFQAPREAIFFFLHPNPTPSLSCSISPSHLINTSSISITMDHQTKASHRLGACSMTRQQQQYHSPPDTPTNPTANDGGEHTTTHSSSSSSSSSAAFVSLTQPGLVLTIPLGVPLKKYDPSTSPPVDKTQQDHIKQHRTATQPKTQAGTAAPKGPTAFNSDSTSTASNNNRNNNSSTTTASSSSSTKKVNRLKVVFNPAVELVEIYEPALDHFRTYRQEILDARLDRIRTIQERITFCKRSVPLAVCCFA